MINIKKILILIIISICSTSIIFSLNIGSDETADSDNSEYSYSNSESCKLTSAKWHQSEVKEGEKVKFTVYSENCENSIIPVYIAEDDLFGDRVKVGGNYLFSSPENEFTWVAHWENDFFTDPEYLIVDRWGNRLSDNLNVKKDKTVTKQERKYDTPGNPTDTCNNMNNCCSSCNDGEYYWKQTSGGFQSSDCDSYGGSKTINGLIQTSFFTNNEEKTWGKKCNIDSPPEQKINSKTDTPIYIFVGKGRNRYLDTQCTTWSCQKYNAPYIQKTGCEPNFDRICFDDELWVIDSCGEKMRLASDCSNKGGCSDGSCNCQNAPTNMFVCCWGEELFSRYAGCLEIEALMVSYHSCPKGYYENESYSHWQCNDKDTIPEKEGDKCNYIETVYWTAENRDIKYDSLQCTGLNTWKVSCEYDATGIGTCTCGRTISKEGYLHSDGTCKAADWDLKYENTITDTQESCTYYDVIYWTKDERRIEFDNVQCSGENTWKVSCDYDEEGWGTCTCGRKIPKTGTLKSDGTCSE